MKASDAIKMLEAMGFKRVGCNHVGGYSWEEVWMRHPSGKAIDILMEKRGGFPVDVAKEQEHNAERMKEAQKGRVYITMTREGVVWRDADGRPTHHLTREGAEQEARDDYEERKASLFDEEGVDPIDEVLAGFLNEDGSITLDDGHVIEANDQL